MTRSSTRGADALAEEVSRARNLTACFHVWSMAPRPSSPLRVVQVARRVRWVYVLEAARWLYTHGRQSWERLTPRERAELGRIVRKTRGRSGGGPTPSEREELRRIVMKAVGMGR